MRTQEIPAVAKLPGGGIISTGAHADSGFLTILGTVTTMLKYLQSVLLAFRDMEGQKIA